MKLTVALLIAGSALVAAILAVSQRPFAQSAFEFGNYRTYSGVIRETPYPLLETADSRYLLVNPGKHGLGQAGLDGRHASLEGSRIWRGSDQMLELKPDTLRFTGALAPPPERQVIGRVHLAGEVVDSKCFLGVMNPGEGKVHRSCAARCISGGVPPMLAVHTDQGIRTVLLASEDGKPLTRELVPFAGETVHVDGLLERLAGQEVLRANVNAYCRLE